VRTKDIMAQVIWCWYFLPFGIYSFVDVGFYAAVIQVVNVPSVLWRCWLGGRKGIRPVKNWVVGYWSGYLTGVRCRLARPSWCHCHSLSLASVKSRLVFPFWYRLTQVVPDKGPLNGCVCNTSSKWYAGILLVYGTQHVLAMTTAIDITVPGLGFYLHHTILVLVLHCYGPVSVPVYVHVSQVSVLSKGMDELIWCLT